MFKKIKLVAIATTIALVGVFGRISGNVFADGSYGLGVSPMKQSIILNAGEQYAGSFTVTNPANNTENFSYVAKVSPFYATEDYNITYERDDNLNQMVDWIEIDHESGILTPNSTQDITFTITVPKDAPAGGQYAAIIVQAKADESENTSSNGTGVNINQTIGIAHTIFAEISGTTIRQGEIVSAEVPSFLFSGDISGSSSIRNTGNVHGTAKYTLQVFPLFSNEEIYTNEEDPQTSIILPDRTRYNETVWNKTPLIGMFNVVYTVEFEGITTQVSKLVIKCPIWLLFIIIFAVIALIIWIVLRTKNRSKRNAE